VPATPPLPALVPVTRLFPSIDYSGLEAAMAYTAQVLREARRRLVAMAQPPLPDEPAVAEGETAGDLGNAGSE